MWTSIYENWEHIHIVRTSKGADTMTRQEMFEELKGKKVAELKEIAKEKNVFVMRPNKANYIEKIIEATVGARERSKAIKSIKLR